MPSKQQALGRVSQLITLAEDVRREQADGAGMDMAVFWEWLSGAQGLIAQLYEDGKTHPHYLNLDRLAKVPNPHMFELQFPVESAVGILRAVEADINAGLTKARQPIPSSG